MKSSCLFSLLAVLTIIPQVVAARENGESIVLRGETYKKGLSCRQESSVMFMTDRRANRFLSVVAIDADGESKGNDPKKVEIDIRNVESLLLEFKGRGTQGCWAGARVEAEK